MDNKKLISSDLYQAILELQAVRQRAKELGLFAGDRDLLECPNCHLMEDVEISGRLSTYFKPPEYDNLTAKFVVPLDTGLRFEETDDEFKCPVCGTIIQLEEMLMDDE